MIIRDCDCVLMGRSGQPMPSCRFCGGTGAAPPTDAEKREMLLHAEKMLASFGDIGAMKSLAEQGELWPIRKDTKSRS